MSERNSDSEWEGISVKDGGLEWEKLCERVNIASATANRRKPDEKYVENQ